MKKLSMIAAALALVAGSAGAVQDDFNVTVVFTGACAVKTPAADITITYPAFSASPVTGTAAKTVVQCSRGLAPKFELQGDGTSTTGNGVQTSGGTVSGTGIVAGIKYTLDGKITQSQTGTGPTLTADGTADEFSIDYTATAPALQPGAGATVTASQQRTLLITY